MPISGAHFNPVVSLVDWANKKLKTGELIIYFICQFLGAIFGVMVCHFIFALPILQESTNPRSGINFYFSEFISTLILLSVIYFGIKNDKKQIPMLVALTVTAGYWFTSSTFLQIQQLPSHAVLRIPLLEYLPEMLWDLLLRRLWRLYLWV